MDYQEGRVKKVITFAEITRKFDDWACGMEDSTAGDNLWSAMHSFAPAFGYQKAFLAGWEAHKDWVRRSEEGE